MNRILNLVIGIVIFGAFMVVIGNFVGNAETMFTKTETTIEQTGTEETVIQLSYSADKSIDGSGLYNGNDLWQQDSPISFPYYINGDDVFTAITPDKNFGATQLEYFYDNFEYLKTVTLNTSGWFFGNGYSQTTTIYDNFDFTDTAYNHVEVKTDNEISMAWSGNTIWYTYQPFDPPQPYFQLIKDETEQRVKFYNAFDGALFTEFVKHSEAGVGESNMRSGDVAISSPEKNNENRGYVTYTFTFETPIFTTTEISTPNETMISIVKLVPLIATISVIGLVVYELKFKQ